MEFVFYVCNKKLITIVGLHDLGPQYILVKGGRLDGPTIDILYDGNSMMCLEVPRIDTKYTNGLGCSYSAVHKC